MSGPRRARGRFPAAARAALAALACAGLLTACGSAGAAPVPLTAGSGTVAPPAAVPGRPSGPDCERLAEGSTPGLATLPVLAAAAGIPDLSALVRAADRAHLTDALNAQRGITVLAPDDGAFRALPAAVRTALDGVPELTAVLTHHVIPGRLAPAQLAGTQITLDDDAVALQATPQGLTVPARGTLTGRPAHVVCGGIRTANATLYVVDQVLKPQRPS